MIPQTTPEIFADLYKRIAEMQRRLDGQNRTGVVTEVNAAEGWARVDLGPDPITGESMGSAKLPWEEPAMGGIKWHIPPKVGEQVRVRSESGDLSDARIAVGSVPSDANPRPHDKGDEHVRTVGDVRILEKDGNVRIEVGGAVIDIKPGKVKITCDEIVLDGDVHLGGEGGKLVHRKGDVDSAGDVAETAATKVYAV